MVSQKFAKLPFVGSIPTPASNHAEPARSHRDMRAPLLKSKTRVLLARLALAGIVSRGIKINGDLHGRSFAEAPQKSTQAVAAHGPL